MPGLEKAVSGPTVNKLNFKYNPKFYITLGYVWVFVNSLQKMHGMGHLATLATLEGDRKWRRLDGERRTLFLYVGAAAAA